MFLTLCIFAISLVLIMVRPRPLNEGTAAALGAFLMLAAGLVSAAQAFEILAANANILLFFIGLMVVSAVADQAGFFRWSAFKAISLANGSGRKLFLIIFGLGIVVTTFFSNDATALILTPIVYTLVTRLRLNPLPYVFVCAFIANTASVILPVSNPVNLLAVDRFGLTLGEYLRFLLLPTALAIVANILLFRLVFRNDIPASFQYDHPEAVRMDGFFIFTCGSLALTAAGYIAASAYGLPLSWPALGGAALLLTGGLSFRRLDLGRVKASISWSILLFIFSLALLVKGMENAGITDILGKAVAGLAARGSLGAVFSITFATAIGSNLINNWSMMMVSVTSLAAINATATPVGHSLVYSAVLGADLGPNIAVLGSLSSMLWLVLLSRRELNIHPLQYLKLGLIVTPPMLLAGALALYACSIL